MTLLLRHLKLQSQANHQSVNNPTKEITNPLHALLGNTSCRKIRGKITTNSKMKEHQENHQLSNVDTPKYTYHSHVSSASVPKSIKYENTQEGNRIRIITCN